MANQIKRHCKLITDQYEMQLGQFLDCIKARAPRRKVSEKSSEKVQRGWGAGAKKSGGLRRHRRIFPPSTNLHSSVWDHGQPSSLPIWFHFSIVQPDMKILFHITFNSWGAGTAPVESAVLFCLYTLDIGSWIFTQNLTLHLSDSSDPGHWSAPTHCQQETFKLWTGFAQIFRCEPLWNRNISSVQKQQDFETNLSDF